MQLYESYIRELVGISLSLKEKVSHIKNDIAYENYLAFLNKYYPIGRDWEEIIYTELSRNSKERIEIYHISNVVFNPASHDGRWINGLISELAKSEKDLYALPLKHAFDKFDDKSSLLNALNISTKNFAEIIAELGYLKKDKTLEGFTYDLDNFIGGVEIKDGIFTRTKQTIYEDIQKTIDKKLRENFNIRPFPFVKDLFSAIMLSDLAGFDHEREFLKDKSIQHLKDASKRGNLRDVDFSF